jgi:hypothetical protein
MCSAAWAASIARPVASFLDVRLEQASDATAAIEVMMIAAAHAAMLPHVSLEETTFETFSAFNAA